VAADQRVAGFRSPERREYFVILREENVSVYAKADNNSAVVGRTPSGLRQVAVDFEVSALRGEGTFWHAPVIYGEDELSFSGYINAEAVSDESSTC
jgi:hypothetical protein